MTIGIFYFYGGLKPDRTARALARILNIFLLSKKTLAFMLCFAFAH